MNLFPMSSEQASEQIRPVERTYEASIREQVSEWAVSVGPVGRQGPHTKASITAPRG